MPKVKSNGHIRGLKFNRYICFLFLGNRTIFGRDITKSIFDLKNKFKVRVKAKVKPGGHIWGLEFNPYACCSFRGNRTIFGWDITNSIFMKIQGQGDDKNKAKSNQVIYRSGRTIVPKMIEPQKLLKSYPVNKNMPAAAYKPVQKHKVTPGILGWLNHLEIALFLVWCRNNLTEVSYLFSNHTLQKSYKNINIT